MKLANLFTDSKLFTDIRHADDLVMNMVQILAARVDELEELLDRECKQNEALDELLMAIGAEADLDTSAYNGKKYLSLGYIREENPHFADLVDYFNLREEEDDERLSAEHQE